MMGGEMKNCKTRRNRLIIYFLQQKMSAEPTHSQVSTSETARLSPYSRGPVDCGGYELKGEVFLRTDKRKLQNTQKTETEQTVAKK